MVINVNDGDKYKSDTHLIQQFSYNTDKRYLSCNATRQSKRNLYYIFSFRVPKFLIKLQVPYLADRVSVTRD